jgi:hypothetical protein
MAFSFAMLSTHIFELSESLRTVVGIFACFLCPSIALVIPSTAGWSNTVTSSLYHLITWTVSIKMVQTNYLSNFNFPPLIFTLGSLSLGVPNLMNAGSPCCNVSFVVLSKHSVIICKSSSAAKRDCAFRNFSGNN